MLLFSRTFFLIIAFYLATYLQTFSQNTINPSFPRFKNFERETLKVENFKNWFDSITNDENYSYKIQSETIDEIGLKHIKLNQYYKNIIIENAIYILHTKNDLIESISGYFYTIKPISNKRTIPIETAKSKILNQEKKSISYHNLLPIYIENNDGKLVLCYEFLINDKLNSLSEKVYVNTKNNKIERKINQKHFITTPIEVETNLSGKKIIYTDYTNGVYTLLDSTRGKGIETLSLQNQTTIADAKPIIDSTNTWFSLKSKIDRSALDVHYGAISTYDYFLKQHNRNSIDNKGYKLTNIVHYGQNFVNAYWDGTKMIFGDGDNKIGPLVSLDIIGHEITHGLTSNTANLLLENESGALNESFSDIFGVIIDFYTRPNQANWTVAEEVSPLIRSLENPSINNDPDTYYGKNWKPIGGTDFGGIHSNNGVQNHWFYLLVNGGVGINDKNDTFNVEGIGIEKASKIVFRNLVYYLYPQSNYSDARIGSIKATEDLFGGCSKEVESVTNAWYAVGVGNKYQSFIKSNFNVSYNNGCDSLEVTFNNLSQNSKSYLWNFGDGTFSEEFEPRHQFKKIGKYSIKLIAYGDSVCGEKDSINKIDYINITESNFIEENITYTSCGLPTVFKPSIQLDTLSTLNWYDKNKKLISTGLTYTFKDKEDSIVFFDPNHYKLGNSNSNLNTAFYNFNVRHLVFDVLQPLVIESVEVNAQSSGERIFEIRDPYGKVMISKKINIPAGVSRVELNFRIDPGYDYQFGIGGNLIGLSRSNTGVKYPYEIKNLISIKRSNAQNAGFDFYYFFYNWDVKKLKCENIIYKTKLKEDKKILDTFQIENKNDILSINIDTINYNIHWFDCSNNQVISFKNQSFFTPNKNGAYSAIITDLQCNTTDTLKCIGFSTQSIKQNYNSNYEISPNPFSDIIQISNNIENIENFKVEIKSVDGKIILKKNLMNEVIDTYELSSGIYIISIINLKNVVEFSTKMVKL